MSTDTPETDHASFTAVHIDGDGVPTEFARNLERERDKWRERAADLARSKTPTVTVDLLPVDQRRLVLAFSAPHWPKPCTTKDLADIAKMSKRAAANNLRALAKRGIVRQWHTDKSGQRRFGCVCWSICHNVHVEPPSQGKRP